MRPRAIADLNQLSDDAFLSSVSEGLLAVLRNASRLSADARFLGTLEGQAGARILENVAREESAKALILMDAVRCPRDPADRFSSHLARFNDHIAKGLYVEAYSLARTELAEIQNFLNFSRKKYCLDGPNDVDWIFRNPISDERERAMYVDYEDTGIGHRWSDPTQHVSPVLTCSLAMQVSIALRDIGAYKVPALAVIADLWRRVNIRADSQVDLNVQTLDELRNRKLISDDIPENTFRVLIHNWKLPLFDLDLGEINVKVDDLKRVQQNWDPSVY